MKTNTTLKTLAIVLLVLSSAKMYAQDDLLAMNTVSNNTANEQVAAYLSQEDKVRISDFTPGLFTASASAHVRTVNPIVMKIFFYDIKGDLAMEESMKLNSGMNELNIDMSSLEKGTYVVQFYSNEGSALRRIVKKD